MKSSNGSIPRRSNLNQLRYVQLGALVARGVVYFRRASITAKPAKATAPKAQLDAMEGQSPQAKCPLLSPEAKEKAGPPASRPGWMSRRAAGGPAERSC